MSVYEHDETLENVSNDDQEKIDAWIEMKIDQMIEDRH